MGLRLYVDLIDVAFRAEYPLSFLDSVVVTLRTVGRREDSVAVAWMGCLLAEGEIDALMSLRAAWLRGEPASARDAAKAVARRHKFANGDISRQSAGR